MTLSSTPRPSAGRAALVVGLAIASIALASAAGDAGQTDLPDARALILDARSKVLDPIAGGGSVRGELHFAVLPARIPSMHQFAGEFRQDASDTEIYLSPTLDQRAPGGKAMSGTQIVVLIERGRVTWRVAGRPGFESQNGPFEFDVPAITKAPFSLLAPPEDWASFPYSVQATSIDPHLLLSDAQSPWEHDSPSAVPGADPPVAALDVDDGQRDVDSRGSEVAAPVEFYVLTTTENCALSDAEEGQAQIWIRRTTGIVERLVVVLRPKESNAGEDTSRAIMTYRNVVIAPAEPAAEPAESAEPGPPAAPSAPSEG